MEFGSEINFIRSCFQSDEFIPLHEPRLIGNGRKYVNEAIDSTFVSSVGKFVDQAEILIANKTGTAKAVAVVNGTAALQICLRLAGVKQGDEVITQALTFVATTNAIVYSGANPVFIDVDLDTMSLSPNALNDFLEEYCELKEGHCVNKKTQRVIRACLPMHTFGFMARMDDIQNICNKWNIVVIEDAAEALGSKYKGKAAGSFGLLSAISFNGNKIITSGGGGAIVSNDVELAKKAKYLTTTAKVPHSWDYFHDELGYNFRMPNLNAALLCGQLENLDLFIESKRNLAMAYANFFAERGVKFRVDSNDTKSNYWLMCVELNSKKDRDAFLRETNAQNVMTRPIWKLMCDLPMYKACQADSLKNSRYLEDRIVNIPSSARIAL